MKKLLTAIPILLLAVSICHAQTPGSTATSTLSVTVGNEAAISINSGSSTTSFSEGSGSFADYTATTGFTYWIRTSQSSGTGSITLKITTDFSPSGGPSVATPPTSGDALTYTCTVQSPGNPCSNTETASTTSGTPVATFGANATSAKSGNSSNSVSWTLTNDPTYQQGSYSATATFTISAS